MNEIASKFMHFFVEVSDLLRKMPFDTFFREAHAATCRPVSLNTISLYGFKD